MGWKRLFGYALLAIVVQFIFISIQFGHGTGITKGVYLFNAGMFVFTFIGLALITEN